MAEFERVAAVSELEPNDRLSVIVDDVPVLLVRDGNRLFAVEDVCTHDGQPLTHGPVSQGEITCPRHGARFDLATGRALCMPATEPLPVYEVQIRDGSIYCRLSEGAVQPVTVASTRTEALPTAKEDCGCSSGAADTAPAECKTTNSSASAERSLDEKMIDALKQVVDPELMINVVDLGLVYSINYDGQKAYVDMTLTSPMCPAGPQIVQQAKMALERLKEIDEAVIKLVMAPAWTPDRMTDEARDLLGIF